MPLGINDLKSVIQLPGTWDLEYLKRFNSGTDNGLEFDELARDIATACLAFNQSLLSPENYWSRYLTLQTDPTIKYDVGGGDDLQAVAEHTRSDPMTAAGTGHMVGMKDYGTGLMWTEKALRRGKPDDLRRTIRVLAETAQNTWDKALLKRLFSSAVQSAGATGKNVPFADGGVADPAYIPRSFAGKSFESTHTHYLRKTDDAAGRAEFLVDGATHLREHGINGPYDLVVPDVDVSAWTALNDTNTSGAAVFIKPERGVVTMRNIAQRAVIDEDVYIGVIETGRAVFYVKPELRLSTDCAGIFRPMGLNNPSNPLVVVHEEKRPLGLSVIANIKHFPFEESQVELTFGIGINRRDAGVLGHFASSGGYVDPTVS